MFQAQLLPGGQAIYSPWFQRGGDSAKFVLDLIAVAGVSSLAVTFYTKRADDTGDGVVTTGSTISTSSIGRTLSGEITGMYDLVRYKFNPGTTTSEWFLFRMLPPIWWDSVHV